MISWLRWPLLDRYLVLEVLRPLLATGGFFVLLFGGYSSAQLLSDAVAGILPMDIVWQLVGLKILIALEVLLPIALYLSVVLGLGRLYNDAEMTAMFACGYSELRVAWAALRLGMLVALGVALLSWYVRPWAYARSYVLQDRAKAQFDIDKLEPGRFHSSESGHYVLFSEGIDRSQARLERVFFTRPRDNGRRQTIHARYLTQETTADLRTALVFHQGYAYDLNPGGRDDVVLHFETFTLALAGVPKPLGYKAKAASLKTLWRHAGDDPKNLAELQWRLLRPVSALLLALLAVPLSRSAPRRGRFARTIFAIVLFAVYYNLSGIAKTWVKEGQVGAMPGLWWVDALLAVIVVIWYAPLLRAAWRARSFRARWRAA
ncbi:lipopolysaccharide export system permease protein [Methylomarinovum caldicuralii]|uniref:Lipopolysaccharide export system permease protein LptF n=1 Tax=Methylomarinovum caldicuralii TaxID=438856 RepID=A0AAU9BZC4_9GAMM|nr:LPS export ABC transporter permease LptF [Methylomarinovum caldicuralii]BCX81700.1 lipopolysaccharide export system permease protein [Methylomarinovum caldicuralii]